MGNGLYGDSGLELLELIVHLDALVALQEVLARIDGELPVYLA